MGFPFLEADSVLRGTGKIGTTAISLLVLNVKKRGMDLHRESRHKRRVGKYFYILCKKYTFTHTLIQKDL